MKATRWLILISGIILVFLGIYAFSTPEENIATIATIVGILFLASGILEVLGSFSIGDNFSIGLLIAGILTTVFGFWVLFTPVGSASFEASIVLVFPLWLLINSITVFVDGFTMKSAGVGGGILSIIFGIIGIIFSTTLMFEPVASMLTLSYFFAYILIFQGISSIIFFVSTKDV